MDIRSRLPENMILDGSYRIQSVIGAGGFGITYRAEDVNLKTTVALKEYYPESFGDRDQTMSVGPKSERHRQTFDWGLASFLREAQMLARFRHPGVVRVARVFEANATAYMVMDFERGKSFAAWLTELGRRPTQVELDRIAGALLEALDLIHKQNFLHRDIAPDNIIVRDDGSPVLLDFGAARRAVAEMSRSLTSIVKAGYSPPEQYAADSRAQGPWTDIYALGATLYLAVAGRPPDDSPSRADIDSMTPAARAGAGAYRPGFLAGIDACLQVKASARPQSVDTLRPQLLGQERHGAPQRTDKVRPPAPVASPGPRRWLAAAVVASVLLGAAYAGLEFARKPTSEQAPGSGVQVAGAARTTSSDANDRRPRQEAQDPRAEEAARDAIRDAGAVKARLAAEAYAREQERLASEKAERERPRQEEAAQGEARDDSRKAETVITEKPTREAQGSGTGKVASAAPAVQAPPEKQAFDGYWQVATSASNEFCAHKSGQFMLAIKDGDIIGGAGRHRGSITPAGSLVMLGPARANPAFNVRFIAKVIGQSGQGQYRVLHGRCTGTFTLRKLS